MKCPFDSETTLSDIVDNTDLAAKVAQQIDHFKSTLTETQRVEFNMIDDMMTSLVTLTQHNTVRELYCPLCKRDGIDCP